MKQIHILLFYKFAEIKNPERFQQRHLREILKLGVKGRILVAKEGINGSVSGTKEQVANYKKLLASDKRFKDIIFKEEKGLEHPFRRTQVLLREEIVALNKKVNMKNTGDYITAEELHELYEKGGDKNFVILDARNYYEYNVGRFKGAIHLNIKTFREFPEALKKIDNLRSKKIIAYCTGGIRCEKATAYMKDKGFKNVYQLKNGILDFGKKFPKAEWQGKCFVFDKRLVSDVNNQNETPLTKCSTCDELSDLYRNCRNVYCDKLYTQCKECQEDFSGCCSKECLIKFRKQCIEKSVANQGRKVMAINN